MDEMKIEPDWYIRDAKQKILGPFTIDQIRHFADKYEDFLVWKKGRNGWFSVKELFSEPNPLHEEIEALQKITKYAHSISLTLTEELVESSGRRNEVLFFARIVHNASAILRNLPQSSHFAHQDGMDFWYLSSIATLTRSLMKAYYCFYYYVCEEVDEKETEYRELLWQYLGIVKKMQVMNKGRISEKELKSLNVQKEALWNSIINHPNKSSESILKELGKSELPVGMRIEVLTEHAGIPAKYFLGSDQVCRLMEEPGEFSFFKYSRIWSGEDNALDLFRRFVRCSIIYLVWSIQGYRQQFSEAKIQPPADIQKILTFWENKVRDFAS